MIYPCRECIILPCCSEICDKVTNDYEYIYNHLMNMRCPDCGNKVNIVGLHIIVNDKYDFICTICNHIFMNCDEVSYIDLNYYRGPKYKRYMEKK